jgi:anaerobic ribonucleoside-triphosphate reductase activating protein
VIHPFREIENPLAERADHIGSLTAQIAQVVPCTEAEGPGTRFAVWFQGCPLRCPGCCNPEFLPFRGGEPRKLTDLTADLARAHEKHGIDGVSLLGGEPFAHAHAAAALANFARQRGLTVMVYTGYTIEALRANPDPATAELLANTDILVDGPYLRDEPETERRWVGSRNQRVHLLTDRYRGDEPFWRQRNTLEIRVIGDTLTVNGFPAAGPAVGLWKGWKRK